MTADFKEAHKRLTHAQTCLVELKQLTTQLEAKTTELAALNLERMRRDFQRRAIA